MFAEIERAKKEGLDREQFDIIKKSTYGSLVRSFNNTENCVTLMLNADFAGVDAFAEVEAVANVTFEDVTKALFELFDTEKAAISIVEPV